MTTTAPEKIEWTSTDWFEPEVTARPHALSDETKTISHPLTGEPVTLHRLVALVDYPEEVRLGSIKAGDKGGWVQSLDNIGWTSWVADDSMVFDNALVDISVLVSGESMVFGNAQLSWDIGVGESSEISGDVVLHGRGTVFGGSTIRGAVHLSGDHFEVDNGTVLEGAYTMEEQEALYKKFGTGICVCPPCDRAHIFTDGQVHSDLLGDDLAFYESRRG